MKPIHEKRLTNRSWPFESEDVLASMSFLPVMSGIPNQPFEANLSVSEANDNITSSRFDGDLSSKLSDECHSCATTFVGGSLVNSGQTLFASIRGFDGNIQDKLVLPHSESDEEIVTRREFASFDSTESCNTRSLNVDGQSLTKTGSLPRGRKRRGSGNQEILADFSKPLNQYCAARFFCFLAFYKMN